ncbi:MAG: hypothetical protein KJ018_16150 [Burkholderiales bacterium]|nr:hypothetical protein [Burkholderiales bacterium]
MTTSRGLCARREPESGAMVAGIVARVVAGRAGSPAGCLSPRRYLGHRDSRTCFAIGALAGTTLPEMLPRAFDRLGTAHGTLSLLLPGAASRPALDRHFHCRAKRRPRRALCYAGDAREMGSGSRSRRRLLLAGDLIHNAVDGSLIVAAFGTDQTLGLAAAAILIRDVPGKIAVILVLVHSQWKRGAALGLIALSIPGIVGGGIAAGRSIERASEASPLLLLFAMAMMRYVAIVELLPGIGPEVRALVTSRRAALMLRGTVCVSATHRAAEAWT